MPYEIGLSDGTKIRGDGTAMEFTESLERMAHEQTEGGGSPYGDWIREGGSDVWFNPAHVVYVRDVQTPVPQVAWR